LRLGTRASPLALAQAKLVKRALLEAHGWAESSIEIVPVVASGDKVQDRPLADVGGKALWTKELDAWLISGEIDFSVHSMKDVETIRPLEFTTAAMLPRADVRDRLLGVEAFSQIPHGAKLGTSAPRRTAQIKQMRPDIEITLFRGNVQTRLRKLAEGEVCATLLAAAGLNRLEMDNVGIPIPVETMLPAPAQGAIGIECLVSNVPVLNWLDQINHKDTRDCVFAERAVLAALAADCRSPVAALAIKQGDYIWLRAEIFSMDGAEQVTAERRFRADNYDEVAILAEELLSGASPQLRATFG
jgi:hydroxymethylbilane synthase